MENKDLVKKLTADPIKNVNMKYHKCICCGKPFSHDNCYSLAGWKETQISGLCELCFDGCTKEIEEPTGICPNCGDPVYNESFCSKDCEKEYIDYLNNEGKF